MRSFPLGGKTICTGWLIMYNVITSPLVPLREGDNFCP